MVKEKNYDKFFEPRTLKQALECPDNKFWQLAMAEELSSLERNKTWTLTKLPSDRNALGCKWVYKLKLNEYGEIAKYKARLVVQGFNQKYGVDYDEVFAPVAKSATFRMLMSEAGAKGYHVHHLDVKNAFLNGKLDETIYMKQPPGFSDETSS